MKILIVGISVKLIDLMYLSIKLMFIINGIRAWPDLIFSTLMNFQEVQYFKVRFLEYGRTWLNNSTLYKVLAARSC